MNDNANCVVICRGFKNDTKGVSAINASELQVNFTAAVDKASATDAANYQLKVNDEDVRTVDILDIALSNDGKVATLLLNQPNVAFQNGDKYVIQTNDAIKSDAGKALEKFVSSEQTFSETAAPKLTNIVKKGDNLELTFDRPVDANDAISTGKDVSLVKIDGYDIVNTDLKPVNPSTQGGDVLGKAGAYTYTIEITDNDAKAQAKKLGDHEVVIFDVKDTASAYQANASVLTGSYTITDEITAPEVVGIEAVNANRFFVETNTSVDLANAEITVAKGSHEFTKDNPANDATIQANDNVTVSAATPGYKGSKPGIWVVVTDNKGANEENPLYRSNETTVDLTVTVEKYTSDGLIGKKATESVTLDKNNNKPEVDSTVLTEGATDQLEVNFVNELVNPDGTALTSLVNTDFVVRDKDGIIVEGANTNAWSAAVNGDKITFTNSDFAKLDAAPYTIEFKKDLFKNAENRTDVADYIANTVKNDAFTVSVGKETASNFKYTQFEFTTANTTVVDTNKENSITFEYPVAMSDSARQAANYTLDGKALPAGTTVDFLNDRKTVKVVFPEGTFKTTTQYKFGVTTNVKTEAGSTIVGSLQTKAPAELVFGVKDNVQPELASAIYYVGTESVNNQTKTTQIEVTFNEAVSVSGNNPEQDFSVLVNGSEFDVASVAQATTGDNQDHKLVLTLVGEVSVAQAATITIVAEEDRDSGETAVTDKEGNKALAGSTVTLDAGHYKYNAALSQTADLAIARQAAEDAIRPLSYNGTDASITLPGTSNGEAVEWFSDDTNFISIANGTATVTRPVYGQPDKQVELSAEVTVNGQTARVSKYVIVEALTVSSISLTNDTSTVSAADNKTLADIVAEIGIVTATFDDTTTGTVTINEDNLTIESGSLDTAGTVVITVDVDGKTATHTVTVN